MTDQEINEGVARKLGHSDGEIKVWGQDPGYDYCHSIAAAWEIVEKIIRPREDRIPISISIGFLNLKGWQVNFLGVTVISDSVPMAICLAFLKLP